MRGNGSMVIAAGEESVYVFSSSAQYRPVTPSPQVTAGPVLPNTITIVPATPAPQKTAEMTMPVTHAVTSVPTTYSIIRTATQSPVPALIPLISILGVVFVLMKRR
jgi:hypothetical protein